MDEPDCNCMNCRAMKMWAKDPHAKALAETLSDKLVPMMEKTIEATELELGSPILLMNYIGMVLQAKADKCETIMKLMFEKMDKEDVDDDEDLDWLEDDIDLN